MASSMYTRPPRPGPALLPPMLTLAGQRARKTWGLLLLTELGLLGAVLLACVVPLYANVTLTAALRASLNAQNSDIVVRTLPQLVSAPVLAQTTRILNSEMERTLGPYLSPAQFSIETQTLQLDTLNSASAQPGAAHIGLSMISEEMAQAAPHLTLSAGRLPDPSASSLEVAVTPATARLLHASVGDVLYTSVGFTDVYNKTYPERLALRLSGLFTPTAGDDFWHGDDFTPYADANIHIYALVSNQALLNAFARFSSAAALHDRVFVSTPDILWYYHLNASHLTIGDLSTLLAGIQQVQVDNANNASLELDPYLEQTQTYLPSPDALNNLNARLSVILFPVLSLVVMILGLVLFFLALMVQLLVDHQGAAIALLRSRGASRWQILFALVLQGIVMAALALVLGLLLTPWLVSGLTWQMLVGHDQGALNILAGGPMQTARLVGLYALLVIAVALTTIVSAAWLAARRDIISLRRETARSTRHPFWQRLRLDMVAAVVALIGSGAAFYLLNSNMLGGQLYLLFLSPLALLQTLLLLLAFLLIIFRFYPHLLRLGTGLVERRRSAPPLLALAQLARSPRQPARVTMLLALASAFAIFALVFTASQMQRVQDVAAYQAGADFSGNIPVPVYLTRDIKRVTQLYNRVPGVESTSLGFVHQGQAGASLDLPVTFQAIDASTFAQTAAWSAQDSAQPLTELMHRILAQSAADQQSNIVPAVVDANAWNTLHLTSNATFTLQFPAIEIDHPLILRAVAEVQHIPTSGNSALPGVLVNYATFAAAYTGRALNNTSVALNYAWLRTRGDASSLTSARHMLTTGEMRLTPLYDRRASENALYADPIYLTLIGELELGAITALFLALLGSLVSSWLNVRGRLLNFVALRALGATPRQIVSTLAWEQGIIYTAALLLGILIGSLFAALSLPALILTSVLPSQITGNVNNASFFAAQFVPPLQIIVPNTLWLISGVLIAICLLALSLMLLKVARSSVGFILRQSED